MDIGVPLRHIVTCEQNPRVELLQTGSPGPGEAEGDGRKRSIYFMVSNTVNTTQSPSRRLWCEERPL